MVLVSELFWVTLSAKDPLSLAFSLLSLGSPCVVGLMNISRILVFYYINIFVYKQIQGLESRTKRAKKNYK